MDFFKHSIYDGVISGHVHQNHHETMLVSCFKLHADTDSDHTPLILYPVTKHKPDYAHNADSFTLLVACNPVMSTLIMLLSLTGHVKGYTSSVYPFSFSPM